MTLFYFGNFRLEVDLIFTDWARGVIFTLLVFEISYSILKELVGLVLG